MYYSNSQTSLIKSPYGQIITKTPLTRQNRPQEKVNDQSIVSQYQSPTLRQAMSPKAAREYLNSLKSFINHYESKPINDSRIATQSSHQSIVQQPYLYFPIANRLNDEIKLMTPQRIEVKKLNQDGTVHSLKYYYMKQPVLSSSNDVPIAKQTTIIGLNHSGKQKLFLELIKKVMPKNFKLFIQTDQVDKQLNVQVNDDLKSTIKSIKTQSKNYQLIAQSDQHVLVCRGMQGFIRDKKDKGILILCIKPGKEAKMDCVQTLKLIENIQKN
ncbi:unnamed protein product [Paramecium pentaurelia]|uniref:Uncharacterized protein n=1 Tax=Paramecium pentaurelia TaxID=43138 RepID=A0A8S1TSY0_9CILI|nr:unnamed protein product [Paramecium pentaurelia]